MKPSNLEIDVTDPKKLERARTELRRLLEIVEFAISTYKHKRESPQEELAFSTGPVMVEGLGATDTIARVVDSLPPKFTTTDVIIGLGPEGKDKRSSVKMYLKNALKKGSLTLSKPGVGRRPSEFEKAA